MMTSSLRKFRMPLAKYSQVKPWAPDGIPIEFYSQYQELLTLRLTALFNQFNSQSSLPASMSEALIMLVPKPGKDPKDFAFYRPISLLNANA